MRYDFRASSGLTFEPHADGWSCDLDRVRQHDRESRLHFPKPGGQLRLKTYLDESPSVKVSDLWDDVFPINSQAAERLGCPTQKPEVLLDRIICASSNVGDFVLDPFCGRGTAIAVAQKLKRNWIEIDVAHLAVGLMEVLSNVVDGTLRGAITRRP